MPSAQWLHQRPWGRSQRKCRGKESARLLETPIHRYCRGCHGGPAQSDVSEVMLTAYLELHLPRLELSNVCGVHIKFLRDLTDFQCILDPKRIVSCCASSFSSIRQMSRTNQVATISAHGRMAARPACAPTPCRCFHGCQQLCSNQSVCAAHSP